MNTPLRKGWTTGACAAAAAKAAFLAVQGAGFPDPVSIRLPRGLEPSFALAHRAQGPGWAEAGIIKDAGDDPDVTHGATIIARVEPLAPGDGLVLHAGSGVGTVTLPGLPIAVGEPSVTPGPRGQIAQNLMDAATALGVAWDSAVTLSIPGGEALAEKTMNGRLGIKGGLSILGTTGVVVPYSCAAWAHSIRRGMDVARAMGLDHIAAATGNTSEAAIRAAYDLPEQAYLDMGDMAGPVISGLRHHPFARLTLAGGPAKLAKLAQGRVDLHSAQGPADLGQLVAMLADLDAPVPVLEAAARQPSVAALLSVSKGFPLANIIAKRARETLMAGSGGATQIEVWVVGRDGVILGTS